MDQEENKREAESKSVHSSFVEGMNTGEQEAEKVIQALKDVKTNLKKVSLVAKLRGLATDIEKIDAKYAEQLEAINNNVENKKESNAFSKEELSQKANEKIQKRSNMAVEKREKNANKALRVTAFLSKGMRLVGAKKISEKMQESMGSFAERYVKNDPAILRVTNSMIESGDLLKSNVESVISDTRSKITTFIENKRNTMSNIDKSAKEIHQDIDIKSHNKKRDEKKEAEQAVKSGKNAKIHYGLKNQSEKLTNVRTSVAHGVIKLATLSEKTASLVGAKGLAKKIKENSKSYAERLVTKDAPIISFTKKMVEIGEISAEGVNKAIKDAKQNIENRVNASKGVKDRIESKSRILKEKIGDKRHKEVKEEMKTTVYKEESLSRKDAEKIKDFQDKSIDRRVAIAQGFLKITGLPESVVRLVGSKKTADKLAKSSFKIAKNLVEKDPTTTKFVVRMMKSGFITKDKVKSGMKNISQKVKGKKDKVLEKADKIPEKVKNLKKDVKDYAKDIKKEVKREAEDVILEIGSAGEDVVKTVKDKAGTVQTAIYNGTIDAGRFVKGKTLSIASESSRVAGVVTGFTGQIIKSAADPLKAKSKNVAEKGIDAVIGGLGAAGRGAESVGKGISSLKQKLEGLKTKINSSHSESENELGLVAKDDKNPSQTEVQKADKEDEARG